MSHFESRLEAYSLKNLTIINWYVLFLLVWKKSKRIVSWLYFNQFSFSFFMIRKSLNLSQLCEILSHISILPCYYQLNVDPGPYCMLVMGKLMFKPIKGQEQWWQNNHKSVQGRKYSNISKELRPSSDWDQKAWTSHDLLFLCLLS